MAIDEEPVDMSELSLPALHMGVAIRVIDTPDLLPYLRENSMPFRGNPKKWIGPGAYLIRDTEPVPQYFWDAEDRWFHAVEIEKIRRAPILMRFFGADDMMIARYKLKRIEQPIPTASLFRELAWYPDHDYSKVALKAARKDLRKCSTSREVCAWMTKYVSRPTKP